MKAPPKRPKPPAVERRELILDAARSVLGTEGMKAFTIKKVAQQAGVSGGLVIYHFGGIEGLLEAVCDSVMFELPDAREFVPRNLEEALANLRVVVERYFDPNYYSRSSLLIWLPLFQQMLLDENFRRKLYARDEAYIAEFAVHIGHVVAFRQLDIDATKLARDLMSFMDGLWLRWCHSDRPATAAEHATAVEYLEYKLGPLSLRERAPPRNGKRSAA